MDFRFSEDELTLRSQFRQFIDAEMTPEVIQEMRMENRVGPNARQFLQKIGRKGWLAPSWPEKYGGIGASYLQRYLMLDELSYRVTQRPLLGVGIAGPTILMFGSEKQKAEYLPRIARYEIEVALGYTEPEAGSDLASIQMRAVEEGDHYVISGHKIFNTACHFAQYHWLAARTDTTTPRHRGISLFLVDLASPGIEIRPLVTMAGWRTNVVYYNDVIVPKENLIGAKNKGWVYMVTGLEFERTFTTGHIRRIFERIMEYVNQGHPVNAVLRRRLAKAYTELEVAHLLALRVAWMQSQGMQTASEAPMAKVFATELEQRIVNLGMSIMGPYSLLTSDSKWAQSSGEMELFYRHTVSSTIVSGASEILRNVIAIRGLGLPRG
ncbi:MAG: acyl-CoA dehydrogenase family protein [Chloroflexi bacterium]|nr:acyl-CoA dehydrogenase family protein [Chloroflexota bacterium]